LCRQKKTAFKEKEKGFRDRDAAKKRSLERNRRKGALLAHCKPSYVPAKPPFANVFAKILARIP
jgi:hypothetical protein